MAARIKRISRLLLSAGAGVLALNTGLSYNAQAINYDMGLPFGNWPTSLLQNSHLNNPGNLGAANGAIPLVSYATKPATSFPFAVGYDDPGKIGDPDSWRTPEFSAYWGLGAIKAEYAYARGFTGLGIKLGVLDTGTWRDHPEFSASDKLNGLITTGIRLSNDPDNPNNPANAAGKPFTLDGGLPYYGLIFRLNPSIGHRFNGHGTHVGGTIAAQRDGKGVHGVAFNSKLYAAQIDGFGTAPIIAGLDALAAQEVRVINHSWGAQTQFNPSLIKKDDGTLATNHDGSLRIAFVQNNELHALGKYVYFRGVNKLAIKQDNKIAETAKSGIVQVFAAGNSYSSVSAFPANLPVFRSNLAIEKNFVSVVALDNSKGQRVKAGFSNICGKYAMFYCVSAPGADVRSAVPDGSKGPGVKPEDIAKLKPDHANWRGTSMAAPHVAGALGVALERYPYMSSAQVRDVLLTTADHLEYDHSKKLRPKPVRGKIIPNDHHYPKLRGNVLPVYNAKDFEIPYNIDNSIKIPNNVFGWGLINLERAMGGPAQFLGDFDVNLPEDGYDIWRNDISDEAIKAYQTTLQKTYNLGIAFKPNILSELRIAPTDTEKLNALDKVFATLKQKLDTWQWFGSLTKRGPGFLSLQGNNSYTGSTRIFEGVLDLHGKTGPASYGAIAGAVEVKKQGLLQGNANLGGDLIVNGKIAPGDYVAIVDNRPRSMVAIGQLNVAGNFQQNPGSSYIVDINPTNDDADLVTAKGDARISSAARIIIRKTNAALINPGNRYKFLTARKIIGKYSPKVDVSAFIGGKLKYDAQNGYFDIVLSRDFGEVGVNANQKATGRSLQDLNGGDVHYADNRLYVNFANLPDDNGARAALTMLSGEIHASTQSGLISQSGTPRIGVLNRIGSSQGTPVVSKVVATPVSGKELRLNFSAGPTSKTPNDAKSTQTDAWSGVEIWGQALGNFTTLRSHANAAKMTSKGGDLLFGLDKKIDAGLPIRLGVMLGYGTRSQDIAGQDASSDIKSYHFGAYGGAKWQNFGLRFGGIYSLHDINAKRRVNFMAIDNTLKSNHKAHGAQLFGEVGYRVALNTKTALEPFVRVGYLHLNSKGFKEKGGIAALRVKGSSSSTAFSTLGLHGEFKLGIAKLPLTLRFMSGWRHGFGTVTPKSSLQFAGGSPFAISGVPIAKDSFVAGLGFGLAASSRVKLSVDYSTQLSKRARDHRLNAKISINF